MLDKIKEAILSGDSRSVKAKKNIILSFGNKLFAIFISFAIIPITIDYLNAEQYGIWLTLSSIVAWLSFFDIGLGHGFRNRFAEAKAVGDSSLARKYVSTTYFVLILIFSLLFVVFECVNPFIDWAGILNVSAELNDLLSSVASITVFGVCASFAIQTFPIMLSADQKPAFTAMIATAGQAFALLVIFILTLSPEHSMRYIAIALSWCPVIITLVVSIWMFNHQYQDYAPSRRLIDLSLIKNIVSLGAKFFIIQISMILIFQVVNVILSRVLGPLAVTEYNVTYKYFSITLMVFNIILSPYWSAFTDAFTKGDLVWMKNTHSKLLKIWMSLAGLSLVLLLCSSLVYEIWLHGSVSISFKTSLSMFIYINILSYSTMYMILLNGTGKVFLQMLIYLICAIISIPLCVELCKQYGIPGVLFVLSLVYGLQAIVANIQLRKIMNRNAIGWWNK